MKESTKLCIWGTVFAILTVLACFAGTAGGILGGIFMVISIVLFVNVSGKKDEEEKKERARRRALYNNPEWRKNNPALAAEVEREKKEEAAKAAENARRMKERSVSICNISLGHYGSACFLGGVPDYAGGWDICCEARNIGVKTIKYVHVSFAAYNAVGDICRTRFNEDAIVKCTFTGPILPSGTTGSCGFLHLWYDIPAKSLKIESIHVDFMDGTSQEIDKFGRVTNYGF